MAAKKVAKARKVAAKPAKHAGGRPTDYKPEHCKRMIELGREGKSPAQIAAALDVARDTLYNWADAHPEFLAAFTRAKDLAQAWFEDKGQEGLTMPGFNASLWAKQVSSRFREDYTDTQRTELTGRDGGPVASTVAIDGAEAYRLLINGK